MALLFKIYTPHFDGFFFSCKTRILGTEIIFRVAENKQQDSFKSQKRLTSNFSLPCQYIIQQLESYR